MRLFGKQKTFYTRDRLQGPRYDIGAHSYGEPELLDFGQDCRLIMGKFCSIAARVTIILGGNHRSDWATTYPFPDLPETWPEARNISGHPADKGDIVIGHDVWLCYGATLLSGARVGDGAVIAAGAVVTGEIPPYAIAAGNPATTRKSRCRPELIPRLLRLAWWDWPEEKIRQNLPLLCSDRLEELLRRHGC